MNILMMTNTYLPHVGGVARSVAWFAEAFRQRGHRVLVVAPVYDDAPRQEEGVVRLPAVQKFNGSDFSVRLPIPGLLHAKLDAFRPEVVHAHHPFLLGDTALRVAAGRSLPMVFTHHTMYERYTHYVPGDSPAMQRFVVALATEFANLCDAVIAPSQSIAEVLRKRGVAVPVESIPTGIDPEKFATGDGPAARRKYGIPEDAFLVGHVGRLAPEKNLAFLARAVSRFLQTDRQAHFLLVGSGSAEPEIQRIVAEAGLQQRFHHPQGELVGTDLAGAYHAMDVFAFASQSETQGMVLAEAMTAGVPVVAVDAPGVREVVRDLENGRLLAEQDIDQFVKALAWVANRSPEQRDALHDAARNTAEEFSMPRCASRVLSLYQSVIEKKRTRPFDDTPWARLLRRIEREWKIWSGIGHAVDKALFEEKSRE